MGAESIMLPDGTLSLIPYSAPFIGARARATTKTIDYEDGGIALQDPSEGLLYQVWKSRLWGSRTQHSFIEISAQNTPPIRWLELPFLEEFSFSFDVSMRPIFAYVQSGESFLNWYDPVEADYVTTALGAGVITPRVSLDDKRFLASAGYSKSSAILAYIRNGNLYTKDHADRFQTETLMETGVKPLIKIGMNRNFRLQFMSEA